MKANIRTVGLTAESYEIPQVEVQCGPKGPGIFFNGLNATVARDMLLRIVDAFRKSGLNMPGRKVTVNITPADVAGDVTGYDLPVALALAAASGQRKLPDLEKWVVLGELGREGEVRYVRGCLHALFSAVCESTMGEDIKGVIIPKDAGRSVACVYDRQPIPVYGVSSLKEAVAVVQGKKTFPTIHDEYDADPEPRKAASVWNTIGNNPGALRAAQIAAAGGFPLLLAGDAEASRTISRAIVEILPDIYTWEATEIASAFSAAGKEPESPLLAMSRPWRAIEKGKSNEDNIVRGYAMRPGEIPLANHGVLHVEAGCPVQSKTAKTIRTAVEKGWIRIPHSKGSEYILQADFILTVSAAAGNGRSLSEAVLSNPLHDLPAVQAFVREENPSHGVPVPRKGEDAASVQKRIQKAHEIQLRRSGGKVNGRLYDDQVEKTFTFEDGVQQLVRELIRRTGLDESEYLRILRIAGTVADLDGKDTVDRAAVSEAVAYRFADTKNH